MSLKGASVLVTGGTRGIGRAIALRLVADGASRAVLGYMRNDTAAEEAAALVEEAGAEPVLVRGNVADARVVEELAAAGPYRVVVHNAATGVIRPALETEDKHWDWTLAANARALLSLARATAQAAPSSATCETTTPPRPLRPRSVTPAPRSSSFAATSPPSRRSGSSPPQGRTASSSTTLRPASSARRSRPTTSTGTGR